jgi:tetratricopeptide (TPR) repeat protein
MWKSTLLSMTGWVLAATAQASCPMAPDHSAKFADLVTEIRAAENELAARPISNQMWELWTDAPDQQAQEVLDRGMRMRESYDFAGAIQEFDRLVEYCPDYAEGYNQRAFVNFLRGAYPLAVPDLQKALELSPDHVAARAGLALTFMQMGKLVEARVELKLALKNNPWLSERHLMDKGGPLAPKGEDI